LFGLSNSRSNSSTGFARGCLLLPCNAGVHNGLTKAVSQSVGAVSCHTCRVNTIRELSAVISHAALSAVKAGRWLQRRSCPLSCGTPRRRTARCQLSPRTRVHGQECCQLSLSPDGRAVKPGFLGFSLLSCQLLTAHIHPYSRGKNADLEPRPPRKEGPLRAATSWQDARFRHLAKETRPRQTVWALGAG
jgi:hypothetical protein